MKTAQIADMNSAHAVQALNDTAQLCAALPSRLMQSGMRN